LADYKETDTLKQQKASELDKTQLELKEVKGRLKTEKFGSRCRLGAYGRN
jgi:hypothetical protein